MFSLTSSLGIAAGILITEVGAGQVSDLVANTLQGLAAGTLLYVVMFEVLSRERQKHLPGLLQLIAVITGFVIMLIIQLFGEQIEITIVTRSIKFSPTLSIKYELIVEGVLVLTSVYIAQLSF